MLEYLKETLLYCVSYLSLNTVLIFWDVFNNFRRFLQDTVTLLYLQEFHGFLNFCNKNIKAGSLFIGGLLMSRLVHDVALTCRRIDRRIGRFSSP